MRSLRFAKMEASGNDFVVIESRRSSVVSLQSKVKKICDRKFGIGADGVLLLQTSPKADVRMRIFNADGSEAEMCGNGARCAALWVKSKFNPSINSGLTLSKVEGVKNQKSKLITIETKAGMIEAQVKGGFARIHLTDPTDLKLDIKMQIRGKETELDYVNTGVPHAVIEVQDIDDVLVREVGRFIRHHKIFKPAGTNVDFFKRLSQNRIALRTYERGVEDETLACGTGAVASAIITALNHPVASGSTEHKVYVKTKSGEILSVYFKILKRKITDVWLEGRARIVFKGEF